MIRPCRRSEQIVMRASDRGHSVSARPWSRSRRSASDENRVVSKTTLRICRPAATNCSMYALAFSTASAPCQISMSATRATALIDALPEREPAFWTMALFAGLRSGELRALRCRDLDVKGGIVRVERGWDDKAGVIEPKSFAGRRVVPLASRVRREVAAHLLREDRNDDDLVFGRTADLPFVRSTVRARARKAWKDAGLQPLSPHEARHCAASYLIAAGVGPKDLSIYVGHSDIRTTFNIYGHALPGNEAASAAKLDVLLGEAGSA
jgi:integrase